MREAAGPPACAAGWVGSGSDDIGQMMRAAIGIDAGHQGHADDCDTKADNDRDQRRPHAPQNQKDNVVQVTVSGNFLMPARPAPVA